MKSWETKHLVGEMTKGHNKHPLLAREDVNYLNACSQWHVGRSGHDLFFLFLFLKNLSLSSLFIPYQALPVLTFKFWFILNTIAHLANSFIPLSNKYSVHHWFILIFVQKVYVDTCICHTIYMYLRHKDCLPFH